MNFLMVKKLLLCRETIHLQSVDMDQKDMNHYAMIGMAHVLDDYPLYYDAVNEKGLGMAGLKFCRKC